MARPTHSDTGTRSRSAFWRAFCQSASVSFARISFVVATAATVADATAAAYYTFV